MRGTSFAVIMSLCLAFQGSLFAVEGQNVQILGPPYVSDEDINVIKVHRVSSPYYETGNDFHSEGDPFNRDCTRLLFLELDCPSRKAPVPARGWVAGKIRDLVAWKTFDEYRQAAKPLTKKFEPMELASFSQHWSPHPGEENIVYTLRKSRKMVVRINVDTEEEQDVISYDPGDGRDQSPRACGWTTDGFLMVVMQDRNHPTLAGGFEVDVLRKTRKEFAAWPQLKQHDRKTPEGGPYENYDEWRRFQKHNLGSGHGGRSPSGRYAIVRPGVVDLQGVQDFLTGRFFRFDYRRCGDDENRVYPYVHNYSNWNASENWYVMNSSGEQGVNGKPAFGDKPEIQTFPIWQVHFFGAKNPAQPFASRKLLVVRSSVGWYDKAKHLKYMEGSRIHINVSKDAHWLYFVATDGNYHQVDYAASLTNPEFAYVGDNWSTCGVFLAECASPKR